MAAHTPLFRLAQRCLQGAHHANQTETTSPTGSAGNSRRQFLKLSAAASVGLSMGGLSFAEDKKTPGSVVIVGGGIAGLTAAYRLAQKGVEVTLYEAAGRLGGRMWTRKDFNKESMFVELGGELVDTNHTDLIDLCKELSLEIQPLKEGDSGVDFYFIKGKRYTDKELIPLFQPLAKRIAEAAEGLENEDGTYTEKAKQLDQVTLADWLKQNSAGVPEWLITMLDAAYTAEYGLECSEQSSLNLIDFINPDTTKGFEMFGESDEAFRIKGGNQRLPDAVANAIAGKVKVHMDHTLTQIADNGKEITLTFETGSKKVVHTASHVILTVPFTILRGVKGLATLKLSDDKHKVIREMAYGNNVKFMMGFTSKVWRKLDVVCNGGVVTDLPFQQCWETSRGQAGKSGILTNFMGGKAAAEFGPDRFQKVVTEIGKVFPGLESTVERDAKGNHIMANTNWPKIRFIRASYSLSGPGQYCSFYETACLPELDGRLLFAGEHTSTESPGFMNGGVQSGNRVAREFLGEPEPEEPAEAEEPTAPAPKPVAPPAPGKAKAAGTKK